MTTELVWFNWHLWSVFPFQITYCKHKLLDTYCFKVMVLFSTHPVNYYSECGCKHGLQTNFQCAVLFFLSAYNNITVELTIGFIGSVRECATVWPTTHRFLQSFSVFRDPCLVRLYLKKLTINTKEANELKILFRFYTVSWAGNELAENTHTHPSPQRNKLVRGCVTKWQRGCALALVTHTDVLESTAHVRALISFNTKSMGLINKTGARAKVEAGLWNKRTWWSRKTTCMNYWADCPFWTMMQLVAFFI